MSKDSILAAIRKNTGTTYEMPPVQLNAIQYADKVDQFITISKGVGGDAVLLREGNDLNELIKSLYPDATTIGSTLAEVSCATFNPDEVDDPHQLNGTDLGVVRAEWGVAENGTVWIPQNVAHRALYFISEHLVILLDKNKLVNNMHEAYEQIDFNGKGFGVFISGPSKTADIEQALVIGAHGAKGVTVILT